MTEVWELLTLPFVARALLVGVLVSLCASTLGVVLVLKRYALIGHGLSEVAFASLSLSLALGLPPLFVSAPLVTLASFAILYVSQRRRVGGDIAIAVAGSAALAFGVLAASLGGVNADVNAYLFGSVLAMTGGDVALSAGLALAVLLLFLLSYNRLFLLTLSEDYARSLGLNVPFWQLLLSVLTALTVVVGMRLVGTLLISSLIILPVLTARRLASSFRGLAWLSALCSLGCFLCGFVLSLLWDLPVGAAVGGTGVAALLLARLGTRSR